MYFYPYAAGVAAVMILCATARAEEGAQPLTLGRVIELVLENNPGISASAFGVRAMEAIHEYAGQFKNPNLSVQLEDFLGSGALSGFSGAQTTVSLSQTFELGGKQGDRKELASTRLTAARTQLDAARLQILADTVVLFLHVAADQQRLAISTKATALAEEGLRFATRRVRSGASSTVEERRARIALARSKISVEHAEHELRASKRRLSAMWGDADGAIDRVEAQLFAITALPNYENLAQQIERSPTLVTLAKDLAVQRARLAAEESRAVPDVTVNLGGRRVEGPESYGMVFGVQIPLPVFQRNQGQVGAASLKRDELLARRTAERIRLLAVLFGHVQELAHARTELEVLDQEVLPEAQNVLDLTTEGFGSGRFSQIELLDAQRTLVEIERERVDAAEKMWTLAVQLQKLVGAAPQDLVAEGTPQRHEGDNHE